VTTAEPIGRPRHPVFLARRMLNRLERRHVEALGKRADWLRAKIADSDPHRRDFLTRELRATEWAIGNLAETPENERVLEVLKLLDEPVQDRGTDE